VCFGLALSTLHQFSTAESLHCHALCAGSLVPSPAPSSDSSNAFVLSGSTRTRESSFGGCIRRGQPRQPVLSSDGHPQIRVNCPWRTASGMGISIPSGLSPAGTATPATLKKRGQHPSHCTAPWPPALRLSPLQLLSRLASCSWHQVPSFHSLPSHTAWSRSTTLARSLFCCKLWPAYRRLYTSVVS
jgi:hypothetical protein